MGAGSDPVWPRFDLAVTFDLSGPGSPPALLPGFRNAPPWGPERANQNEEEPQRAVCDWRRGEKENINNQSHAADNQLTSPLVCMCLRVFSMYMLRRADGVRVWDYLNAYDIYKPLCDDFHTSEAPFVLVVEVFGRTQKSEWTVCLLRPPLTHCEQPSQSQSSM